MRIGGFHFNDKQRAVLCACWKRSREHEIATLYLQEVELLIKHWQYKATTTIKQQIALANNLRINLEKTPALLDQLPKDFEGLLATVWLRHQYGEAYFQQVSEACRKDADRNTGRRMALEAFVRGFAPHGSPKPDPIKTEVSKPPPNYFQQTKTDWFSPDLTDTLLRVIIHSEVNDAQTQEIQSRIQTGSSPAGWAI